MQKSAKTVWGSGSGCSKNLCPLDGGIRPPPPGATVLSNAYLLDSNLSLTAVDSHVAIHLLNKLGLEL